MTQRKQNREIEVDTLVRSRRRCCVCFGLNDDLELKQGQLAHLDQNPSNTSVDNLAFLCLNHHDQYDSKPRQSKSLQITEVKKYRSKLYKRLEQEPSLSLVDSGAEQPEWDLLSAAQKNAILFDKPHKCTFCDFSFLPTPRLEPNKNVYMSVVKCPKCGNADSVTRFYGT